MKWNQNGNATLTVVIGVVGVLAAATQFKGVSNSVREADRHRLSTEMESQALSSLNLYKGLLSATGPNAYGLYPEPYLSANPKLNKFAPQIPSNTSFQAQAQTVSVAQPQTRNLDEAKLTRIMTGAARTADFCQGQPCARQDIKLLGFNRDVGGAIPERIVSADVEITTQVRDDKTGMDINKKILAQVPIEPPKVTSAVLRLTEVSTSTGTEKFVASADTTSTRTSVTVGAPDLAVELIVGGVAVAGEITIVELNQTFSSDDAGQWGLNADGYPKHPAISIKNTGARLVKTPVFTVENGKSYTVVGQIQGVDESIPAPVLKLVIEAALPQPPDASMCASKCSNTSIWYDGPYKGGAKGTYASMVPGKWSCMKHEGKSDPIGAPIFSFDPANNCEQEGPVGFRDKAKGCFAADTLIRMGDGRLQKIQDIMPGDRIWNPLLQKAFRVKQVKAGPETQELLRLSFAGRRQMIVTPDHPFLDQWGTVVQAKDLASMLTPEGMHSVVSAEVLTSGSPVPVFNLEIDAPADNPRAHFLEANGAVAGDLFLQNSLKGQHALTLFDEPGDLSSEAIFFARASEF